MGICSFRPILNAKVEVKKSSNSDKKEDVLRLVEAQIAGNIDLSPEEIVDAAFIMVDKINNRIDGKED